MNTEILWGIIFLSMYVLVMIIGWKDFRNSKGKLKEELYNNKIKMYKSKLSKVYTKYEGKIKTLEENQMAKENVQFNAFAQANDRMKMLIESFCDNFEVDMHEFEKNLFCIAYERGFADGQYELKKSIKDGE